ncbi:Drug/metabolite exporter family protein [hydrothermal vent metagenome]|uniref:Drug/metabolite exporter family protein n=1 Tax=hydrothermal vent metagenome TaxID=652676 RepID=A0A161JPM7_9ZZZZ
MKLGLTVFPPMWSAFVRFSIATICVLIWARYRGISVWPRKGHFATLLIVGTAFTIQITVMNIGFSLTSGTVASILQSTNPLFVALFAHFMVSGDRMNLRKSTGLVLAFMGVGLVLLKITDLENIGVIGFGGFIVLASSMLLGLRLVLMVKPLRALDEVPVVFWMMVIGLVPFAVGGLLFETVHWENLGWVPVAGLLYQGVVIAGLGFMVFSYLMKRYSPSIVASFNFVSPLSGVLLSMLLLGDELTASIVFGVVFVGMGLYLIAGRRTG